jgi:hypothetical protein
MVQREPTELAIERSADAKWQNIALGGFFTASFIARQDFTVQWYVCAMLAGFGVINAPAFFGKAKGSVGPGLIVMGAYKAGIGALGVAFWPTVMGLLALLLHGCGGVSLADVGPRLQSARDALVASCEAETPRCEHARLAVNAANAAYTAAYLADVAQSDDAGALAEQADSAVATAVVAVREAL